MKIKKTKKYSVNYYSVNFYSNNFYSVNKYFDSNSSFGNSKSIIKLTRFTGATRLYFLFPYVTLFTYALGFCV